MTGTDTGWDRYLDPGERLLWEGRPSGRLFVFRTIDLFFVPFSIVWAIGALAGGAAAFTGGAFPLAVGLIFLAAAFYVTIGRFLIDQYLRRKTVYALSDKRAFIARSAFGRQLRELPITPALAVEFKDGQRGSVWLGERPAMFSQGASMGIWHGEDGGFTFRAIEAPEEVYALVREVQRGVA